MGNCATNSKGGYIIKNEPEKHVPPAQRLDRHGRPILGWKFELSTEILTCALQLMAGYISEQEEDLTVIIVGGVVNSLIGRDRRSTYDVNFLGTNLNSSQRVLLGKAAKYV
jgi:hypothetical protein